MTHIVDKTPVRKNGGPKLPEPSPVPDAPAISPQELAVRHGIAQYQQLVAERDDLEKHLHSAHQLGTVAKIEIEQLRADNAELRRRIESYQRERDMAVAHAASMKAKWE